MEMFIIQVMDSAKLGIYAYVYGVFSLGSIASFSFLLVCAWYANMYIGTFTVCGSVCVFLFSGSIAFALFFMDVCGMQAHV